MTGFLGNPLSSSVQYREGDQELELITVTFLPTYKTALYDNSVISNYISHNFILIPLHFLKAFLHLALAKCLNVTLANLPYCWLVFYIPQASIQKKKKSCQQMKMSPLRVYCLSSCR